MPCDDALRVQAYFDGELDAGAVLDIELHIECCQQCAALLADLEESRRLFRETATYHRMGEELREEILAKLDREDGQRVRVVRPFFGDRRFLSGA